jgi:hypothetical protein
MSAVWPNENTPYTQLCFASHDSILIGQCAFVYPLMGWQIDQDATKKNQLYSTGGGAGFPTSTRLLRQPKLKTTTMLDSLLSSHSHFIQT